MTMSIVELIKGNIIITITGCVDWFCAFINFAFLINNILITKRNKNN